MAINNINLSSLNGNIGLLVGASNADLNGVSASGSNYVMFGTGDNTLTLTTLDLLNLLTTSNTLKVNGKCG